jgi:hypothetical protein
MLPASTNCPASCISLKHTADQQLSVDELEDKLWQQSAGQNGISME